MHYLVILSCLVVCVNVVESALFCPLKWELAGYGNATSGNHPPTGSVIANYRFENEADAEYVGRVFHDSQWLFGRIQFFKDGQIHIAYAGREFNYSMYQILTNPNNCILTWKPSSHGATAPFSVAMQSEGSSDEWTYSGDEIAFSGATYYVGSTEVTKDNITTKLAGNINPITKAISVGYQGNQLLQSNYEILTSTYPELVVELSEFRFDIGTADFLAMEEVNTRMELIGQDNLVYAMPNSKGLGINLNQKINHAKIFQEVITLQDDLKWSETHLIKDLHLGLWFGGSDVIASDIPTTMGRKVKIGRAKDVSIDRDVSLLEGSESSSQVEVCSLATILENPKIQFTATGTFYEGNNLRGNNINAKQIAHILEVSGRKNIRIDGDQVTADVTGVLGGRYFLRSMSFVAESNDVRSGKQSCLTLYPIWLQTQ